MKGVMGGALSTCCNNIFFYDLRCILKKINKNEIHCLQCWVALYALQTTHVKRRYVHKLKE